MSNDLISRRDAIEALWKALYGYEDKTEKQFQDSNELDVGDWICHRIFVQTMSDIDRQTILNLPPAQPDTDKWIQCNERLPEDTCPVNITWVNHDPVPYYKDFKDKPFTATGHYCGGKWYWYSVTCQDYLDEYGTSGCDKMDEAIEVIAWRPLPEPYGGGE